ncbi:MAG: YfcE family phosphodiesterase [Patescibacteria group bacterium]|jgi:hypothetical protein
MLIAIISDIHDNLPNLKKCLTWCRDHQIKKLIFCGDATTTETLAYLAVNFSGEIFIINGNIEISSTKKIKTYKHVNYYEEIAVKDIDKLKIGFCHEPQKIKKLIKLTGGNLDYIFYGHTHKPWLEKNGQILIINPGNISGTFYQATFAVLETVSRKIELKILTNL